MPSLEPFYGDSLDIAEYLDSREQGDLCLRVLSDGTVSSHSVL